MLAVQRYLTGCVLLILGGCIYIFLRPSDLFGGLPELFPHISAAKKYMPEWILYTMPDALWFTALLSFQKPLMYQNGKIGPFVTVLACLTAPVHEMFQLLPAIPGTFCPIDMTVYLSITVIYIIICLRMTKNQAISM